MPEKRYNQVNHAHAGYPLWKEGFDDAAFGPRSTGRTHVQERTKPVAEIRLASYTAPWGAEGLIHAIADISRAGFEGIECPAGVVQRYEDRLHVFEEILESERLRLVGLLQALHLIGKEKADEQVERAVNCARFLGAAGHGRLTVCHSEAPGRDVTDDEFVTAGAILTEIGLRCRDFGVDLCFMPRARFLGGSDREVKRILAMTAPETVSLTLDTAELTLAGMDPAKIMKTYVARVKGVRFRDVSGAKRRAGMTGTAPGSAPTFGRGAVKFEAVSKVLLDVGYDGWVTLDVSGESAAPKLAVQAGFRYLMRRSGLFPV